MDKQRVWNQIHNYWFPFICFNICIFFEHYHESWNVTTPIWSPSFIQGNFQLELVYFKLRMLTQVILTHFLAFIISFFPIKVHNMLAVMLDLQFKIIKVVNEFVGNDAMTQGIMKEYDQKIVLPMFLHVYFHLNHVSASISLENHLMIFSLAHF